MLNIALDGFSGAGKSVVSERIAEKLNIKKFDTGAVYRGLACEYISQNLPYPNEKIIDEFIKDIKIEIFFEEKVQHVVVNGKDYTKKLREESVGQFSSIISQFASLRQSVLKLQRDFALKNDCIMEGRDIGSVVLPKANVKIFLTASLEIRALRRMEQLRTSGVNEKYQDILENLLKRDHNDLTRKVAPLIKVDDAIEVDGSNLSLDEVVAECIKIVNEKIHV